MSIPFLVILAMLMMDGNSTLLSFLNAYVLSTETLRFEEALKGASSLDDMILRHNEQYVFTNLPLPIFSSQDLFSAYKKFNKDFS